MRMISCIFSGVALLCLSCLEPPVPPEAGRPEPLITVRLAQDSLKTSLLRASPGDTLLLFAQVQPDSLRSHLKFTWFSANGDPLGEGDTLAPQPTSRDTIGFQSFILRVSDSEGNHYSKTVNVILDAPPSCVRISAWIPRENDTLRLASHQEIIFTWETADTDLHDALRHVLEIAHLETDTLPILAFNTGTATRLGYGNLTPGDYRYRVRVSDSLGLSDTSTWIPFHIRSAGTP